MEKLETVLSGLISSSGGCLATTNDKVRFSVIELSVSSESLVVRGDKDRRILLPFTDILYACMTGERTVEIGCMGFDMDSRPFGCCPVRRRRPRERSLMIVSLQFTDTDPGTLAVCLNDVCFGNSNPMVRSLVVVNPIAGKGSAKSMWTKTVEPLMRRSQKFDFQVTTTDRSGHALDIGATSLVVELEKLEDDSKLFLVVIGGDGIIYELLNGVHKARPDAYQTLLKRLILCPLPAGSGNGLCCSALCIANETFDVNSALRLLVRQQFSPKDLGILHYRSQEGSTESRLFSLTISWGLVADVDVQSEFLRKYVGESRFTVYGLVKVLRKQAYAGTITSGDYQEIEPDYLTVLATLVPAAGRTVILSPTKSMADGRINLHRIRSKDVSRYGLIKAMDELAKRRDHSKNIKGFKPLVTDNFELVPDLVPVQGSAGIVVDGEQLTSGPIRVDVLPSACNIFSSLQS